jgi:predicted enzyme related to lactoylglutathione lyase
VNEVSGTWRTDRPVSSAAPGVLIYIMVKSVEDTLAKVEAHGGKTVQPVGADLPEITARIADPAGNVFGVFQQSGI